MNVQPPRRIARSHVQSLHAPPEAVLPLLCPVREADWIPGWEPGIVIAHSGLAEPDCVFTTADEHGEALWYVTRHGFDGIEMIKLTPGVTAARLNISLEPDGEGTAATATTMLTSLGEAGDAVLDGFTADYYEEFMRTWEARLNHYLETGEMLG